MRRIEDEKLVRGQGRYTSDIAIAECLHVAFVRSPFAHGRIVGLETAMAAEMPGVVAVFTGKDVAGLGSLTVNRLIEGIKCPPYPILALEKVMAVGQPVAAVLAESAMAAVDAAENVLVDIDIGPHHVDIASPPDGGDLFVGIEGNEVLAKRWTAGDAAKTFEEARHVVCASVRHPRLAPSPLETRSVAAEFLPSNELKVWLSTQTPHRAREELSKILGRDAAGIRVIAPDVGGAFGMKASLYPEDVLVAWAASRLKRSVSWRASRNEDFMAATHGRGAMTQGRLALDGDGRFLALEADIRCPFGHWLPYSAAVPPWNAARILPGPYHIDTVDISMRGITTNTAPVGIYRGAGRPEAAALMERLVEAAADATGIDPVELRLRNLVGPDEMPRTGPTGTVLDSGDYPAAIRSLCDMADYPRLRTQIAERRAQGGIVGAGLAFYVEPSGQGWESARVRLDPDGRVTAATGTGSQGQGRETAYAQIIAEVFDIAAEDVAIVHGDTELAPAGIGALASRSTPIGGSALLQAAIEVRDKAWGLAEITEPITADVVYTAESEAWGYGCYLAVVSLDADTGALTVEQMTCVDDAGTIVNPMLVEGQILGGIAQGVGEAVMERMVYDEDGQLLTGSLMDYALPRAEDLPPITIAKMAVPTRSNPLGAKGVGEAGAIGAPAAILNATLDAVRPHGVRHLDMPLTSETLWRALRDAGNE